jgi:hypothetical protein
MALLKVLNGDSTGVTYAIGEAALKVGRAEGNDLQIPDGSVSSRHCEMWVDSVGNLAVRDLGSTNGTFHNGQRVSEAFVQPGQRIRLGNLEFMFEGDQSIAAPPPPPPAPAIPVALNVPPPPVPQAMRAVPVAVAVVAAPADVLAGPNDCINHPGTAAAHICPKCSHKYCKSCTKQKKLGMAIVDFCPSCNGQLKKASVVAREAAEAAERPKTFMAAVTKSFSYPFKGNGLILLISGTIFYAFLDALMSSPAGMAVGFFKFLIYIIAYGYMFAYMQKIVVCSAAGDIDPPDWPEVADIMQDIVQPFFQLFITLIVSFFPSWYVFREMGPLPGQFTLLLGMLYFPMALLGVAMSDSYASLNPIFVASSIMRALGAYIITCVAFAVLIILYHYVKNAVFEIQIPLLPFFAFWFIFLTALIIAMRLLGVFYYMNRRELGWGV